MDKIVEKFKKLDPSKWYLTVSLVLFGIILFIFRLGNTPKGLSITEVITRNNLINHAYSYSFLLNHFSSFLFYGYYVILNYTGVHSIFAIRLVGIFCGLIGILMFYYITRTFTNKFIAIVSTVLFATNLWFLQIVRNSQTLEFYSFVILLGIYTAVLYYRKKNLKWLALAISIMIGLSLYVPGMVWFALLFVGINFSTLRLETKLLPRKIRLAALSIFLVLIAPIVYESLSDHSIINTALFIPSHINWHNILIQFLNFPKYLFIQNNASLQYSVGRLPLINFASTVLIVFSGFWIVKNWKNPIVRYIYASLGLGWILSALNNNQSIYIILPLISLLIPIGIYYLYKEWKKIFPRNPYSDISARIIIGTLVAAICLYNILLYFIVWPHYSYALSIYSHYL
jgi:4-amino-4-deoxy-L-arabinose transferase-like glycosyltransferase